MVKKIQAAGPLTGVFRVPGDKSVSHRAIMLGALAEGVTEAEGFLTGEDCLSTVACFRRLGVETAVEGTAATVWGRGLRGLRPPEGMLDVGNSGTTLRLLTGILAGQPFPAVLTGDASIRRRPMARVMEPLRAMGARIEGSDGDCAPVRVRGGGLRGITYRLPVASAQVKSAILLAGLYAEGETVVQEPQPSRDHTERMLQYFGADLRQEPGQMTLRPGKILRGQPVAVPGDISSAAFLIALALIVPGSSICVENVGVNPTRTGILTAFQAMGASIRIRNPRTQGGEPVADIEAQASQLRAGEISGDLIPTMIDEIPIYAAAALFAEGTTVIRDAGELKVKESNRIQVMAAELAKLGGQVEETPDGLLLQGGRDRARRLAGAPVDSHQDHRTAMSLAVLGRAIAGETAISGAECVGISFPGFFEMLG
jgi:3-phosphoshikimate 1-carboxyvinyltransferase